MAHPATWGDLTVTWGALWHSWAGEPIPMPRARSASVLLRGFVAPVFVHDAESAPLFSHYPFAELVTPASPVLWADPAVAWADLHHSWDGLQILPAKARAVPVFTSSQSVFALVKTGAKLSL